VATPYIWFGRRVSAKGLSKGAPDFESGPNLVILFKEGEKRIMGKKEKAEKKEKPLDKMTAKELRELALSLGTISGVHGMNKEEILAAVKEARGIVKEAGKKGDRSMRDLKEKLGELRGKKEEARSGGDKKAVDILRKRISRLKKKTHQAA
jgi:hypothetical protein